MRSGRTRAPHHAGRGRGDYLTVGYRAPADLYGLTVLRQIPQLHAAQVPAREARAAASRPGLRVLGRVVGRVRASEPALNPLPTGSLEWQYVATRSDLVPEWVQRAASTVTIAVVDTGADLSAPDLAAKAPIAHGVVTGRDESRDTVGHGTFVASLAAGSITNGDGLAGFGGDAQPMVVEANLDGATFTDLDEAVAIVWAVDHGARIVNLSLSGGTTSRVERAANPTLTAQQVAATLTASATGGGHWTPQLGWGVVDVAAAVARAGSPAAAPPAATPTPRAKSAARRAARR